MKALATLCLLLVLVATACRERELPDVKPPCGVEGDSRAGLGLPNYGNDVALDYRGFEDNYAEFTTTGGDLYLTTYGAGGGGIFHIYPQTSRISFGKGVPTWKEDPDHRVTQRPTNAEVSLSVYEDHYTVVNLPAGRYWATGARAVLEVIACNPVGVSDARPAPDWEPIEPSTLLPPCGEQGVSRVELGSPTYELFDRYQDLSRHARFSTTGGDVYITVNGIVDSPVKDRYTPYAKVYMGLTPPRRDSYVADLPATAGGYDQAITEGGFAQFEKLIPGTFWVFVSPAANVSVISCDERGVYDAQPMPSTQDAEGSGPELAYNGESAGTTPLDTQAGSTAELTAGGFAPYSTALLTLHSNPISLGSATADGSGVVRTTLTMPKAPAGVHTITIEGEAAGGVAVAQEIRVRYPGRPVGGSDYSTYFCCFESITDDYDPEELVDMNYGGVNYGAIRPEDDGGVLVTVPVIDPLDRRQDIPITLTSQLTGKVLTESINPIPSVAACGLPSRARCA